jgi:hypothetical protein
MSIKSFRFKLSEMTEQLKLMRYTVQRTRSEGITTESQYLKNFVDSSLTLNSTLISQDQTQKLFLERYKQLYFNYYNSLDKDNTRSYSYR